MDASNKYPPYFKYLEVNITIGNEKPPQVYFFHDLKKGRRLKDD